MNIYYFSPSSDIPSWGVGMIYYHVWLLNKNNFNAFVLHDKKPFKITWLDIEVPIKYLDDKNLKPTRSDFIVIPEVCADNAILQTFEGTKIVFVQNAFYIYEGLSSGTNYEKLGISTIFYYMPHLHKILSNISNLPLYEMPPFVAPYFFKPLKNKKRKKQIVLYPKFHNKEYDILKQYITDKLNIRPKSILNKFIRNENEWEIVELRNKKHKQIPEIMQQAMFFVSINTTEAFNSAVPEAMASGCINFCYEAVGPADFLINEVNAFVFQNSHIYTLAEKLVQIATQYNENENQLNSMRQNALETVQNYTIEQLEVKLVDFFNAFKL